MADRALTRNAGDPTQVKRAGQLEKTREKRFVASLLGTMATADGRALLWALIGRARVYESVFHRDQAVMAHAAGRQDFGHELLAEIIAADPRLYLLMENEARQRDTRDDATVDAAHTPSADKEHTDEPA